MNITVSLGWWIAPTIVTIAAFLVAFQHFEDSNSAYGMGAMLDAMLLMGAAIVSLIAWLIWAVLA